MRKIIHIDMDAFYASVEQRDRPELVGRPVLVGGSPSGRGVVAAASYEARAFGVHSAMPSAQAARLCPQAVFLPADFDRYRQVSKHIHRIFHRYTDLVEPLALDEAYLDVTRNHHGIPTATEVARLIRADIRRETGLTASAGVAPNKFLAKVASDRNKPDGLCVVPPERVEEFLRDLPVERVPGVGPKTAARLRELGVRLVPDLLRLDEADLAGRFGKAALSFRALARGIDERPVSPSRERKSVSIEDTFERDIVAGDEIERRLEALTRALVERMRRAQVRGRTVTLKVKYHDFRLVTRSRTLDHPVDSVEPILQAVRALAEATELGEVPARLLGVGLSHLEDDRTDGDPARPQQLDLPFPVTPPATAR